MATIYLRSTDGNDSDDGSTWALAKATLASALTAAGAGGLVYVSQAHAETAAGAKNLVSPGTNASPTTILCVNDGAEPPTTLAETASVTTTGSNTITFSGVARYYGIDFKSSFNLSLNADASLALVFEKCILRLTANSDNFLRVGSTANTISLQRAKCIDCTFRFNNGTGTAPISVGGLLEIIGGSVINDGAMGTTFATALPASPGQLLVSGLDLSAYGSGKSLVVGAPNAGKYFRFAHCKLGASVALMSAAIGSRGGMRVDLVNCDSGDTNYRSQWARYEGDIYSETTLVMTGGASDGTTPLSHKFVSTANALLYWPLTGPEIPFWISTTGSKTVTVEILHDSATNLQDADIWLEIEYLGTSGFPISTQLMTRPSHFATPADHASSSVTWTTTGMSNPNKQKIVSASFTVNEIGVGRVRVVLAKASKTVYVDPHVTVA